MTKLWPRLNFIRLGELDPAVPEYDADWLKQMAQRLQETPKRPTDWNVGQCLLDLADTPRALRELNRAPDRFAETRELNIAVHLLAQRELAYEDGNARPDKAARAIVAKAWSVADKTVKDAILNQRKAAARALKDIIKLRESQFEARETLALLCEDLTYRANLPWLRKVTRSRRGK